MAHRTLALPPSTEYSQGAYSGTLVDSLLSRVARAFPETELSQCEYECGEETGMAAGLQCRAQATIHNLADEHDYCERHFEEVRR